MIITLSELFFTFSNSEAEARFLGSASRQQLKKSRKLVDQFSFVKSGLPLIEMLYKALKEENMIKLLKKINIKPATYHIIILIPIW